jgi:hypothetical protein
MEFARAITIHMWKAILLAFEVYHDYVMAPCLAWEVHAGSVCGCASAFHPDRPSNLDLHCEMRRISIANSDYCNFGDRFACFTDSSNSTIHVPCAFGDNLGNCGFHIEALLRTVELCKWW